MLGEFTRGTLNALFVVGIILFGAAAWLLLGPRWAIAGVLAGPVVVIAGLVAIRTFTGPNSAALLGSNQPAEAIAKLSGEMPGWRTLARIWPGQFRNALASRLMIKSGALQAAHLDDEALQIADEAIAIYQDLAAERPGKYGPDLADALDHQSRLLAADDRLAEALAAIGVAVRLYRNLAAADPVRYLPALAKSLTCQAGWLAEIELPADALAAVHEATGICQDKLPWPQVPSCAPRAALLEGELLCGQDRYREAARILAQGWTMAAARQLDDLLRGSVPSIRAAYRADPGHFTTVWHAETGHEPPDWLTN
jgi:tetratricopeptide (TPR) repeat protein